MGYNPCWRKRERLGWRNAGNCCRRILLEVGEIPSRPVGSCHTIGDTEVECVKFVVQSYLQMRLFKVHGPQFSPSLFNFRLRGFSDCTLKSTVLYSKKPQFSNLAF